MTSSLAVFEAVIWVKSTNMTKIRLEKRKKEKICNKRYFYMNLHLIDCFDIGELMPEEALTSFTISDAYR